MSWSTLDLRNDLKRMEEALDKETDYKKKDFIVKHIADLKHDITCEELQGFENDEDFEDDEKAEEDVELNLDEGTCYGELTSNIPNIESYRLYYPFIERHRDICNKDLERDYVFIHHGKLKLSDDEINTLIHDFYKSTNKYIYNKYLLYEKDKDKILSLFSKPEFIIPLGLPVPFL